MKHRITLATSHRARDQALAQLVTEVLQGGVSEDMLQMAHQLQRPLAPHLDKDVVHLYARNWEVAYHNGQSLGEILLPAELFTAEDDGKTSLFDEVLIPRKLRLKVYYSTVDFIIISNLLLIRYCPTFVANNQILVCK